MLCGWGGAERVDDCGGWGHKGQGNVQQKQLQSLHLMALAVTACTTMSPTAPLLYPARTPPPPPPHTHTRTHTKCALPTCVNEVVLQQHLEVHVHTRLSNSTPQPLRLLIAAALRHCCRHRRQAVRPRCICCCSHLAGTHTGADQRSSWRTAAAAVGGECCYCCTSGDCCAGGDIALDCCPGFKALHQDTGTHQGVDGGLQHTSKHSSSSSGSSRHIVKIAGQLKLTWGCADDACNGLCAIGRCAAVNAQLMCIGNW